MNNTRALPAVLTAACLLAVAACGGDSPDGDATEDPTVLTVALGIDPANLDTIMISDTPSRSVLNNISVALIRIDEDGQLEPALAESWEAVEPDRWEFRLREDVTFHNGEPFDAEAVKYTLERLVDPDYENLRPTRWENFDHVEIIDDHTVQLVTKEPSALVPILVGWAPILEPGHAEEIGQDAWARAPIGTGPFEFVEWVPDERIVLRAYDDHWRGRADVDELVFRPIPEASTRVAELQTGAADVIVNVPPAQVETLEADPDLEVLQVPSNRFVYVGINMESNPVLDDPRVRQALNYAVDVDTIIDTLFDGEARAMSQPIHDLHHFHSTVVEPYPYDPDRARQLLGEAGAEDLTLSFDASQGRYLLDGEVIQALAAQLEEVGITVDLEFHEWGQYSEMVNQAETVGDLFFLGWGTGTDADQTYTPRLLSGAAGVFYSNPDVDELIADGATEVDTERRQEIYDELARLTHEDAPWIYLYAQNDIYAVSGRLSDWAPAPDENLWFYPARIDESA